MRSCVRDLMRKLGYASHISFILNANSLGFPQQPRAAGPTPIPDPEGPEGVD
jgi:hypothetical protein